MYIVYKIINDIDPTYYIGVHKIHRGRDIYLGGGLKINRLIRQYGREHFTRLTVFEFETDIEAFDKEKELLRLHLSDSNCLNISPGGYGGLVCPGMKQSKEAKEKIRLKAIGRKYSKEVNLSKGDWSRNKTYHDIYGEREFIEKSKRSISHKGQKFSETHRMNISKSKIGSKHTTERIEKQRESLKRNWICRKLLLTPNILN
jgi:hypothetical protein